MKRILLILVLLLTACEPTPQHVSEAIVRGRLGEAAQRLADLLNKGSPITAVRLDQLLGSIKASRRFTLDVADDLMDRLKPAGRRAVFPWYMKTYLEVVEVAMKQVCDSPPAKVGEQLCDTPSEMEQKFNIARAIWKRNQKVRSLLFPSFQEDTPVLGLIDLREAEYWASRHLKKQEWKAGNDKEAPLLLVARNSLTDKDYWPANKLKARRLLATARKKLTLRKPFDRIQAINFKRAAEELTRKLK